MPVLPRPDNPTPTRPLIPPDGLKLHTDVDGRLQGQVHLKVEPDMAAVDRLADSVTTTGLGLGVCLVLTALIRRAKGG
jgi:hypothetical protein